MIAASDKVRLRVCPDCDDGTIARIVGDRELGRETCQTCRGTERILVHADGTSTYADPNEVASIRDHGELRDETGAEPVEPPECVPPLSYVVQCEELLEQALWEMPIKMHAYMEPQCGAFKCGWRGAWLAAYRELKGGTA